MSMPATKETTNSLEDYPIHQRLDTIHDLIRYERETYIARPRMIQRYRDYAEGRHKIVISISQKRMLQHIIGSEEEFCDNICGQIVFESRGRLKFSGWDCEDENVAKWLRDRYITCALQDFQIDAHNAMLVDGNHVLAVNVDPIAKNIQVYQEKWWNGIDGIFISYDALRQPLFAVKDWYDSQRNVWRRIIWYPDRLERYASQTADFNNATMINLPGDPFEGGQAIPWVDADGAPLGLPYVHLSNGFKPKGPYGLSELQGGILGIQNQLNAAHWDLTGGSQMTAYQMYWGTGVKFTDSNGRAITPSVGAGNWVHTTNKDARFGVFQAGDLSQMINNINEKRATAAAISATPVFRLIGKEWPSAEAIMRSEQPSVEKARTQIAKLIPAYSSLGYKMVKIANRFGASGKSKLPTDIAISAIVAKFEDPERRDQLSKSVINSNLGDDVPVQEKWRIMGYSDEKIAQMYKELKQNIKDGIIADKNAKAQAGANPFGSAAKPQQKKIQQQQKPINGNGK